MEFAMKKHMLPLSFFIASSLYASGKQKPIDLSYASTREYKDAEKKLQLTIQQIRKAPSPVRAMQALSLALMQEPLVQEYQVATRSRQRDGDNDTRR